MRRYAAFALTALLLLALLGCGGGASIVGKWTDEADYGAAVIEFTRDGQVKTYSPLMPDLSITMAYKVNGSDITMTAEGEDTVSSTVTFRVEDDALYLTPVSYTHLDVYKRQSPPWSWARRIR